MIKLVALDMDGTLLDVSLQIPPATHAAIAAARARGVRFVIVTGRMFQSAAPYAKELGLEGLPLVSYNGALVSQFPSGETIYHEPLPLADCLQLAHFCEARGYHLQAYVDDRLYVPALGGRTPEYLAVAQVEAHPVGPLSEWLHAASTKMLILADEVRMPQIQAEVQAFLGAAAHVAPSHPTFLEIVSSKVSKGVALAQVAAALGVEQHEVMAVGDGMNDLAMLTWAVTSFAISHAPEALKAAATHVTRQGAGHGVAEALERMGLTR
jgi:Cof subfamily protein (haloacid dehalogenase superfamily)